VSVVDEILARNNPYSGQQVPAPVTNRYDYNRDGSVSVIDQILSRNNSTTQATKLQTITVPSSLMAGGLRAQALAEDAVNALFPQAVSAEPAKVSKPAEASAAPATTVSRKAAADALFGSMGGSASSSIRSDRVVKLAAADDLWNLL
jgi:hypothetical protein